MGIEAPVSPSLSFIPTAKGCMQGTSSMKRPDLSLTNVLLPDGRKRDLLIADRHVIHAGHAGPSDRIIDCTGCIVIPGAVDMHVHMRDWQQSGKEDWGSGTRSALAGGVTVVIDQPNTVPPIDTVDAFYARVASARERAWCSFGVNAGIGVPDEIGPLWQAGVMAFGEVFAGPSMYGSVVHLPAIREALSVIHALGALATIHAEVVSEGAPEGLSSHSRLRSPEGEVQAVTSIGAMVKDPGQLHFCHMSTAGAVAAAHGSVEVTPHHLYLAQEMFEDPDARGKVNPPLRCEAERRGLWKSWDKIDVIASDHAPHTRGEKMLPFPDAPSGIPGVETMLPLLMHSVVEGRISLDSLIEKTSRRPSDLMGIPRAGFLPGDRADFAVFPKEAGTISADCLHSRAGWTPFEGMPVVFPSVVVCGGAVAFEEGEFPGPAGQWIPGRGYIGGKQMRDGADKAHP